MDHSTLIKAWEQIEQQEVLAEGKKRVVKPATKLKGKVTAVGKEKFEENGGGAGGAGVGGNPAPTAGGTMTQSGNAAKYAERLGKKVKVKEDASAVKSDANRAAQQAVSDVKSGRATDTDAKIVGSMVEEDPLPPGADEVAADLGVEDPHAEGPEAAAVAHDEDPAAEEAAEDVTVDAETAEQVVDAIMKQYPGAVITISVQLPDDAPFDTDIVAAAQEVAGVGEGGEEGNDGAEIAPEDALDGAPVEEPVMETRKVIISKTRKQVKELFARMHEEPAVDDATDKPAEVPADAQAEEPVATPVDGVEEEPKPEVEVGDTKISLSPEQWGQVLATTDLLNADESGGEAAPEGAEEGGEEGGEEVAPEGEEGEEKPIDELRTEVDLDSPNAKMTIRKKIEKGDFKKDKKIDVPIKPAPVNESFNAELEGYVNTLNKLLIKD